MHFQRNSCNFSYCFGRFPVKFSEGEFKSFSWKKLERNLDIAIFENNLIMTNHVVISQMSLLILQ